MDDERAAARRQSEQASRAGEARKRQDSQQRRRSHPHGVAASRGPQQTLPTPEMHFWSILVALRSTQKCHLRERSAGSVRIDHELLAD
jgi:hypothetical protein